MSRVKQSPNRRRRNKAVPVLGAAGLSLALASGASAATASSDANVLMQSAGAGHEITLREEEVADVSLATFYVFDKESAGAHHSGVQLAARGCGHGGCGCRGCAARAGCRGCARACRGCARGCAGCGGGCGGCCIWIGPVCI